MFARLLVASFGLTLLTCGAACVSSGAYAGARYAAAAAGIGAAGAAANRAAGGCVAQCIAGTHCNRATGLCVQGEATPAPRAAAHETASGGPTLTVMSSSYPAGHEYEIPSAGGEDAGCAPAPTSSEMGDGGALACELEGGTF